MVLCDHIIFVLVECDSSKKNVLNIVCRWNIGVHTIVGHFYLLLKCIIWPRREVRLVQFIRAHAVRAQNDFNVSFQIMSWLQWFPFNAGREEKELFAFYLHRLENWKAVYCFGIRAFNDHLDSDGEGTERKFCSRE